MLRAVSGYEVLSKLGEGGMGAVMLARQTSTGRNVALKYLTASGGQVRERFLREGKVLSELRHPGIVEGYGMEVAGESLVLVCEYIEGTDLEATLRAAGRLTVPRGLEIMGQLLEALEHAHAKGIVHRDLKPANILMTREGAVKLGDFGMARLRDVQEQLTRTGAILGTPNYMAPEQAQGLKADAAADIYSAGVLLFEMLSGELPIKGVNPVEMCMKVPYEAPLRLEDVLPGVDPGLSGLVARCLAKRPEDRFPSIAALRAALATDTSTAMRVRTTKRIPVAGAPDPNATHDGAPSGIPRRPPGGSRKVAVVNVAPPPAPGMPAWALPAVSALCVVLLGGGWLVLRTSRATVEQVSIPATPLHVFVQNGKDGQFLTRVGGRLVLAFDLAEAPKLLATLNTGRGQEPLERLSVPELPNRQVFAAPPERLLDAFEVTFSSPDGRPVVGGAVKHPGLISVVQEFQRRLWGSGSGLQARPKEPIWPQYLEALARAVGGTLPPGLLREVSMKWPVRDIPALRTALRQLSGVAATKVGPLLAAVPVILDLPGPVVGFPRKLEAHEALLPLRLLDRACASLDANASLDAESALGRTFTTAVRPPAVEPRVAFEEVKLMRMLVSPGFQVAAEDVNIFSVARQGPGKREATDGFELTVRSNTPPASPKGPHPARLDLKCRMALGAKDPFGRDELVWLAFENKWRILVHSGCRVPEYDTLQHRTDYRVYCHGIDAGILETAIRVRFTREILPSESKTDRRGFMLIPTVFQLRFD